MTLHDAGEAAPLGGADDIHSIARFQKSHVNAHPNLNAVQAVGGNLAQLLQARRLRRPLLDVARFRLVQLFGLVEAELNRNVPIPLDRAKLRNPAWSRLD